MSDAFKIRQYNYSMRRTSHIAVRVTPEQVENAVSHYNSLLGTVRKDSTDGQVGLVGENFTIWIDSSDSNDDPMQEFAGSGSAVEKQRFIDAGCEIFDESKQGFHVRDPFGLVYHVWVENGEAGPE